jgi:hypothetical protein
MITYYYIFVWINIFYLAFEDYRTAMKDEDHIGYIPLWACISLSSTTSYFYYENLNNALLFTAFWLFNTLLMSKLEKKNAFDIMGVGDYFILFSIGFFINGIDDFIVFILSTSLVSLLYIKIKHVSYFPMVPSIVVGFLFEELYGFVFLQNI